MPQVGQGLSRAAAHMQGESPSWVCVPCPWVTGRSHAAIESMARHIIAMAPAPTRSPNVARSGSVRSICLAGLGWFICIWMYASNAHLIPVCDPYLDSIACLIELEHTLTVPIDVGNEGGEEEEEDA